MEVDEITNSFSSEEISNFHKLAQQNGAVFTTKSFVVSQINKYQNNLKIDYNLNMLLFFRTLFVLFFQYKILKMLIVKRMRATMMNNKLLLWIQKKIG